MSTGASAARRTRRRRCQAIQFGGDFRSARPSRLLQPLLIFSLLRLTLTVEISQSGLSHRSSTLETVRLRDQGAGASRARNFTLAILTPACALQPCQNSGMLCSSARTRRLEKHDERKCLPSTGMQRFGAQVSRRMCGSHLASSSFHSYQMSFSMPCCTSQRQASLRHHFYR